MKAARDAARAQLEIEAQVANIILSLEIDLSILTMLTINAKVQDWSIQSSVQFFVHE